MWGQSPPPVDRSQLEIPGAEPQIPGADPQIPSSETQLPQMIIADTGIPAALVGDTASVTPQDASTTAPGNRHSTLMNHGEILPLI